MQVTGYPTMRSVLVSDTVWSQVISKQDMPIWSFLCMVESEKVDSQRIVAVWVGRVVSKPAIACYGGLMYMDFFFEQNLF